MEKFSFYTPKEVAEILRVDYYTVLKWIRKGELEAVRLGNKLRISSEALERFIDRHKVKKKESQHKVKKEVDPIMALNWEALNLDK